MIWHSGGLMEGRWRTDALVAALILVLATSAAAQEANERIQQLYKEARADEKGGRPDAAIQKYNAIVKLDPKNPAVYSNLGRLYYEQGQLEEAIPHLKHAIELDPKLEPPHALLGFSYYQMGDFEHARGEFKTALELNPHDGNAKLFLARSLIELDDVKGALRLLEQLQQEAPRNAEVLYSLGTVYAGLAESTLSAIQTVDPNSYLIELLLGRYAEVKQVYPEAAEHYKKAIAKAPGVLDLYYRYAHALWAGGDLSNALAAYRHVLKVNPSDYRASWEAARIVLPNDPDEAFRLVNRALELKPGIAEALTIRGRALLALRKPTEAIEDFKKASTLDPEDATNHFQLARAYRQLGLTQQAQDETAIYEHMQTESHSPKMEPQSAPQ
jgi:tetratricopeptide (TPR) repeat protein